MKKELAARHPARVATGKESSSLDAVPLDNPRLSPFDTIFYCPAHFERERREPSRAADLRAHLTAMRDRRKLDRAEDSSC
ncbi:MAG: hypothetical protein E6H00_13005 [Bacillati bacterium ANGP1]|uniref:Uncharacterized protein n=1 Tax=Candidatus Segetimicrobium genomatis TaxID=2569760 RepID=A0A537JYR1_9BACT|nr:MAG: hypothetical protein E6H00_13005 [Terrabacteria group bacterium ANGP1]